MTKNDYTTKPLPCPFCGKEPWGVFGLPGAFIIECHTDDCGDWHISTETKEEAVQLWNRRDDARVVAHPTTGTIPSLPGVTGEAVEVYERWAGAPYACRDPERDPHETGALRDVCIAGIVCGLHAARQGQPSEVLGPQRALDPVELATARKASREACGFDDAPGVEIPTDPFAVEFLSGVVGAVEANSFELMKLWEGYQSEWQEDSRGGPLVTVGELAGMPVCIALNRINVKGHSVAIWHATSQVVDHRLIDAWLSRHLPKGARKVGAMNFHNVFPRQIEPSPVGHP